MSQNMLNVATEITIMNNIIAKLNPSSNEQGGVLIAIINGSNPTQLMIDMANNIYFIVFIFVPSFL